MDKDGFVYLGQAISLSPSVEVFSETLALLRVIRNMISHSDWERLETINAIYTNIDMEENFANFLRTIHEYALWMKTTEDSYRRYERMKGKLNSFFSRILNDLIEVNEDDDTD